MGAYHEQSMNKRFLMMTTKNEAEEKPLTSFPNSLDFLYSFLYVKHLVNRILS